MEHTELYHNIVKEHNLDQLYSIVGEELCAIGYVVVKIEIREEKKLRYVFCQIKNKEVFPAEIAFSAMTLGLFVKITSIIPNYKKPFYYLPVIVMCDDYDDRVKGLINRELSIGHELQHIKDILDLIKQYPDYPEKSFKFGINSITEVEDLVESIDFEMFKLF